MILGNDRLKVNNKQINIKNLEKTLEENCKKYLDLTEEHKENK